MVPQDSQIVKKNDFLGPESTSRVDRESVVALASRPCRSCLSQNTLNSVNFSLVYNVDSQTFESFGSVVILNSSIFPAT